MQFGNVKLHLITDGTYWEDGGALFGLVPKPLWAKVMEPDERNRLPFKMRCLLIETAKQRILVDTGYGDKLSAKERGFLSLEGERRLLTNLENLGVGPLDVDLVINTHLHGDHCGGNTLYDQDGELAPAFPWATYCVQRLELADASFPNERTRATYRQENFQPLEQARQLRVVWGDTRLTDEIRVVVTPGHTRAHQCVVIESAGQTAIFLGDVASWPIHMERLAWVPAFDVEPLVSIETKRNLAQWAVENRVLLIFQHHPEVEAGYLHTTERPDRFWLEAVEIGAEAD
ncbi:MAG: MBL fold metallo-hydrolase [Anaerolineae bacterium]|jgi:glyoxylase-like metal-dependent hydrolase (beta-lactamase superfamily II)